MLGQGDRSLSVPPPSRGQLPSALCAFGLHLVPWKARAPLPQTPPLLTSVAPFCKPQLCGHSPRAHCCFPGATFGHSCPINSEACGSAPTTSPPAPLSGNPGSLRERGSPNRLKLSRCEAPALRHAYVSLAGTRTVFLEQFKSKMRDLIRRLYESKQGSLCFYCEIENRLFSCSVGGEVASWQRR